MKKRRLQGITIECLLGDIADQPDVDAVVNAANAELKPGGGVAGAIHRAAGPGLEEECRPFAPIGPGEALITAAHSLPNRHVIHCLGPVYGRDEPGEKYLAACYRNALRLADNNEVRSIAFPAISTGAFGYPVEEASQIAFAVIGQLIPELSKVSLIRFVLHDSVSLDIYERELKELPAP